MQFKKSLTCVLLAATTIVLVGCTTPTRYGRSTGEYIDDQTVTSNVKSALNRDSLTDGTQIQVNTFRGNVQLTGWVQHPAQKQQADQIVRRVDGVQHFKNDIIVMSELPNMQSMRETEMREPSGAEASGQNQQYRSSGSGSSGWQRGSYNKFGPRDEFNESAGAEAEVEVNTDSSDANRSNQERGQNRTEVEKD